MKKTQRQPLPEGLKLLVVEDNTIVALDVDEMLSRSGAERLDIVGTPTEALQLLATRTYDAALLDLKPGGGDCLPVADRLSALGIPFAFATGYGGKAGIPARFSGVPMLAKPYSEAHLKAKLVEVLDDPGTHLTPPAGTAP